MEPRNGPPEWATIRRPKSCELPWWGYVLAILFVAIMLPVLLLGFLGFGAFL